jgi:hypothetical protein
MKILNNYTELIIAIESNDTKRFENLLAYSDCRNDLINKYVQNYGITDIRKIAQNIEATALKNELEKICMECTYNECKFNRTNVNKITKTVYIHEENILSNQLSHNYKLAY